MSGDPPNRHKDPATSTLNPLLRRWRHICRAKIAVKENPSYWVGYHIKRKCVMYGHSGSQKYPELARNFALAVGCNRTEIHGGSPACVLLDESEIEKTTDDDLIKQIEGTFRLFEDTVNKRA